MGGNTIFQKGGWCFTERRTGFPSLVFEKYCSYLAFPAQDVEPMVSLFLSDTGRTSFTPSAIDEHWPKTWTKKKRNTIARNTVDPKQIRKRSAIWKTLALKMRRMPGKETQRPLQFSLQCGWPGRSTGIVQLDVKLAIMTALSAYTLFPCFHNLSRFGFVEFVQQHCFYSAAPIGLIPACLCAEAMFIQALSCFYFALNKMQ